MARKFHEVRVPKGGLWRSGRWDDVDRFPPPARSIQRLMLSPGPGLYDGYRWEDAFGRFSTAKFSASEEAAVGRTLARYRASEVAGVGLIDKMKAFLTHAPDNPAEPELITNEVPPSYFEDACVLHLDHDPDVRFIDVESERTRASLAEILSGPLRTMGYDLRDGLSFHRDRRLTRLVTSALREECSEGGLVHVAGLKYKAPDRGWDAYVVWDSPARIDFAKATVRPLFPSDEAVQAAAATLGLKPPT